MTYEMPKDGLERAKRKEMNRAKLRFSQRISLLCEIVDKHCFESTGARFMIPSDHQKLMKEKILEVLGSWGGGKFKTKIVSDKQCHNKTRTWFNRKKPKALANYVFYPIIFVQIPKFLNDHDAANPRIVFLSLFLEILNAKIKFKKTKAWPLISPQCFLVKNIFKDACRSLIENFEFQENDNDNTVITTTNNTNNTIDPVMQWTGEVQTVQTQYDSNGAKKVAYIPDPHRSLDLLTSFQKCIQRMLYSVAQSCGINVENIPESRHIVKCVSGNESIESDEIVQIKDEFERTRPIDGGSSTSVGAVHKPMTTSHALEMQELHAMLNASDHQRNRNNNVRSLRPPIHDSEMNNKSRKDLNGLANIPNLNLKNELNNLNPYQNYIGNNVHTSTPNVLGIMNKTRTHYHQRTNGTNNNNNNLNMNAIAAVNSNRNAHFGLPSLRGNQNGNNGNQNGCCHQRNKAMAVDQQTSNALLQYLLQYYVDNVRLNGGGTNSNNGNNNGVVFNGGTVHNGHNARTHTNTNNNNNHTNPTNPFNTNQTSAANDAMAAMAMNHPPSGVAIAYPTYNRNNQQNYRGVRGHNYLSSNYRHNPIRDYKVDPK